MNNIVYQVYNVTSNFRNGPVASASMPGYLNNDAKVNLVSHFYENEIKVVFVNVYIYIYIYI